MTGVLRRGMLRCISGPAAVDRWSVVLMVALVLLSPVLYELGAGFARRRTAAIRPAPNVTS